MATLRSASVIASAKTAATLALIIRDLVDTIPAPIAAAAGCRRTVDLIATTLAPRIVTPADAGAIATRMIGALQTFARSADQPAVAREFYAAAATVVAAIPTSASPVLTRRYRRSRAMAAGLEAALLGAAFVAEARVAIGSRQAAIEARRRIDEAFRSAQDRISTALSERAASLLESAARATSQHLARKAADLRPVVKVKMPRSYPATAVAWRLYGDPTRSPELLRRARCGTPMFMPLEFTAASPYA